MSYVDVENDVRDLLNGETFNGITLTAGTNLFSGSPIDDDSALYKANNLSVFIYEIESRENTRVFGNCSQIEYPNVYISIRSSIEGGRQQAKIVALDIYNWLISGNRPTGYNDMKAKRTGAGRGMPIDDKGRYQYNLHFELFRVNEL